MKLCLLLAPALALAACTAKTISPPLTARGSPPLHTFGGVRLTSGAFREPHRVMGVIQMTQSGFKWMHEIEIVDDANPASLLFKIGSYAHEHGADGVQHLQLVDERGFGLVELALITTLDWMDFRATYPTEKTRLHAVRNAWRERPSLVATLPQT